VLINLDGRQATHPALVGRDVALERRAGRVTLNLGGGVDVRAVGGGVAPGVV
jgi:hypothetical protein